MHKSRTIVKHCINPEIFRRKRGKKKKKIQQQKEGGGGKLKIAEHPPAHGRNLHILDESNLPQARLHKNAAQKLACSLVAQQTE